MVNFTRRQVLAGGAAAVASTAMTPSAFGQVPRDQKIRLASIFPARTGLSTVRTSINDYPGEAARMGVQLAEALIGEQAEKAGYPFEILHANAPVGAAAGRAAQRLVETGRVAAFIGGVGDGHAEAIGPIAEAAGIPFFNIGNSTDALRRTCGRFTFHVEASAAMYLDVMAQWAESQKLRRYFVVYEDTEGGRALHTRMVKALQRHAPGGQVVASAAVKQEQAVYYNEFNLAERENVDLILLLIGSVDQIAFLAQEENSGLEIPSLVYPDLIGQTRDYIATARSLAPVNNPRTRVALWEASLETNNAGEYNQRFGARFSEVPDPTSWAAYATTRMVLQAVQATGTTDGRALVDYFENPASTFDIAKGPGVSFRRWDHQLRQPLYLVNIDQEVEWVRTDFSTWVALGTVAAEVPGGPAANAVERLDRIGDAAADATCRW